MLCHDGTEKDLKRPDVACEWKSDGTRVVLIKHGQEVLLHNRYGIIYTARLPEVVKSALKIPGNFILDGEATYVNPKTGREEFTACQRRCATHFPDLLLRQQFPITYKAFDILELNGLNVEKWSYLKRKQLLNELLHSHEVNDVIQYVPHHFNAKQFFEEVKKAEGEGVIVKKVDSPYLHERSYNWLKVKNWRFEICDVVGYTPGKNSRAWFFGSLVLAKDGKYRGCVGSGFSDWELRFFKDKFADAEKIPKPFNIGEDYTAVKTNLKVKVKYYEVTNSSVLRHPVFVELSNGNTV